MSIIQNKFRRLTRLAIFGFVFPVLSFIVAIVAPVQAQEALGFSLSPPTFEVSGNPGDILKNTVRVENFNNVPITVGIDRRNFTAVGEEGAVGLTEDNTTYALASWITTDQKELTLPAHSSRIVNFTITIPSTAEPGGHFGSLVIKTTPTTPTTTSGAAVSQELGCLILLRVSGTVQESATIASFRSTRDLYEYGPVTFDLRLQNHGSVHLKPKGTVVITDLFGRQVTTLELNGQNVLPDATRLITLNWPIHLALGRYTATLVATYGSNPDSLTATTTFTILPYRLILAIVVGLTFLTTLLYRSRQRLSLAFKVLFVGKT